MISSYAIVMLFLVTLAVSGGKRNVTVWCPSVRLSRRHTHRDSPGGSMRLGQRTFRPDNKADRHICFLCDEQ